MKNKFLAFLVLGFFISFSCCGLAQQAAPSKPTSSFEKKLKEVETLILEKKWDEAQKKGRSLLKSVQTEKDKVKLSKLLRDARYHLIYTKIQTETSERYEVQPGDSLGKIAKKHNTTVALLKKANGLKKDVIYPGMKLKVEKVPFSIEVSIKKNTLWLKQGQYDIKKYRVSTGEKGNTPDGKFKIVNKLEDPTWYYEKQVIAPGDPKNGLGTRWLGFDLKGYGIHGTIEPEKIGQPASLGCVRLRNEDVEEIFDLVPVGTSVVIRKQ